MIELVGRNWGLFGSPGRGTRVSAMWSDDVGAGGWVFVFGGREWFAVRGGRSGGWTARVVVEEESA